MVLLPKLIKGMEQIEPCWGGILGFATDDLRIRDAFSYAGKEGLEYTFTLSEEKDVHPNTADMDITGKDGRHLFVRGISIWEGEK